jgi:membrane associated rhomboid family serine protease
MTISASGSLARSGVAPHGSPDRSSEPMTASKRRGGRRAISMALLLSGVFAFVSGFWTLFLGRGSPVVPIHVASGSVFGVLSLLHVRYNRNALRLYLRDLGWSPTVLRLVVAAAISLILLAPALRLV